MRSIGGCINLGQLISTRVALTIKCYSIKTCLEVNRRLDSEYNICYCTLCGVLKFAWQLNARCHSMFDWYEQELLWRTNGSRYRIRLLNIENKRGCAICVYSSCALFVVAVFCFFVIVVVIVDGVKLFLADEYSMVISVCISLHIAYLKLNMK